MTTPANDQPTRRDFMRLAGAAAVTFASFGPRAPAFAGPFAETDFDRLVPADKKLDIAWLRSLVERGEPEVWSGKDLETIGMPIGGICTGQLYLGGDGRLWHWDIFNTPQPGDISQYTGPNYALPRKPLSPIAQGFDIAVGPLPPRRLDRTGFSRIRFRGEYPLARIEYADDQVPVSVSLEAFSPFIPLQAEDSGLPATVLRFTVKNSGSEAVEVTLAGSLENAVLKTTGQPGDGVLRNRVTRGGGVTLVEMSAIEPPAVATPNAPPRPPILIDDFEKPSYEGWTATGTAFGAEPIVKAKMPPYQGDVGSRGKRLVNTHNTRQGEDVGRGDVHTGTLTSREIKIERRFINFLLGGGAHEGKTCIHLLVGGKVVRTVAGRNDNRMRPHSWDVRDLEGQSARLQIVDEVSGAWGNIGVDHLEQSDEPAAKPAPLRDRPDFGTLALALLDADGVQTSAAASALGGEEAEASLGAPPVGRVAAAMRLAPGEERTATFAVAWYFPNPRLESRTGEWAQLRDIARLKRHYARRFDSAAAVVRHLTANFGRLHGLTRLWRDTWYDSTLPHWLLDRSFLNISTLATATCNWFDNGRFYGWEGTYCCPGTCTHVWHYAQAVGRIFPEIERATREMVDYGLAFHDDNGLIGYRAEFHDTVATDGQAGTILRAYREHQMSADDAFLRRIWPRVKKSIEYLLREDGDSDGILEGGQANTLDAVWYGPIAWLSSLYLAAVRAGDAMATEMGDAPFASRCRAIAESGSRRIVERLFNGEHFVQIRDPKHPEALGSGEGCLIDQVFGQSWAFQVGLGRVIPRDETVKALESLWKYSFTPDVGTYRAVMKRGRWYAMAGEGGLLMCTWPKGGAESMQEKGNQTFAGYFNECMTGFEYQVAGHMIWEGLVEKGLAIARSIHDRYHPSRRNPYNEVECGDHYARAMASHGVFIAACGFEHHGPREHLGFAPRLTPESFRAPFTAAESWGTIAQQREGDVQRQTIAVRHGKLRARTLAFEVAAGRRVASVEVTTTAQQLAASVKQDGTRVVVELESSAEIVAGQSLVLALRLTG